MKQPVYSFGSADPRSFAGSAEVNTYPVQYPFLNALKRRALSKVELVAGEILKLLPPLPLPKQPKVYPTYSKTFVSFTPCDMKVYLDDVCIAETQMISFTDCGTSVYGELTTVLFDRSIREKVELNKPYQLTLVAATDEGTKARATIFDVAFDSHTWQASTDDIVTEEKFSFNGRKMIPLRTVEVLRDEDGNLILDEEVDPPAPSDRINIGG